MLKRFKRKKYFKFPSPALSVAGSTGLISASLEKESTPINSYIKNLLLN